METFEEFKTRNMPQFEDPGDADDWLAENGELVNRHWHDEWLAQRDADMGEN